MRTVLLFFKSHKAGRLAILTAATGERWRKEKAMLFSMTWRLSNAWQKGGSFRETVEKPEVSERACLGSGQPPEEKDKLSYLPE